MTEFEKVIVCSPIQSSNAAVPISVIPLGIVTFPPLPLYFFKTVPSISKSDDTVANTVSSTSLSDIDLSSPSALVSASSVVSFSASVFTPLFIIVSF